MGEADKDRDRQDRLSCLPLFFAGVAGRLVPPATDDDFYLPAIGLCNVAVFMAAYVSICGYYIEFCVRGSWASSSAAWRGADGLANVGARGGFVAVALAARGGSGIWWYVPAAFVLRQQATAFDQHSGAAIQRGGNALTSPRAARARASLLLAAWRVPAMRQRRGAIPIPPSQRFLGAAALGVRWRGIPARAVWRHFSSFLHL